MLPTFPKVQQHRMEDNFAVVEHLATQISPMLGMIARHAQFEGAGHAIERHDDTVSQTKMASITGEVRLSRDLPLADFTPAELLKQLGQLAEQMARGTTENFVSEMNREMTAVGNVVDGGGKPLSEDLLIEMFAKMEHTFDEAGRWRPPTVVTGGNLKALEEIQSTASFQCRLGDILRQKRDDFRRREADRILAG